MRRILSWVVIVLGAIGMIILPRVFVEHCPEWFPGRIHRIVGTGLIQAIFFTIMWSQVRTLRALREQQR